MRLRPAAAIAALSLWTTAAYAAPPPASAYAALPTADTAHLSPDGQSLAFIDGAGQELALVISDVASGQSRPLPTNPWNPRWVRWKDSKTVLAGLAQTTLFYQSLVPATRLFAFTTDNVQQKAVIFDNDPAYADTGAPNIQDDLLDTMPATPDHILMQVSDPHGEGAVVYQVALWSDSKHVLLNNFSAVDDWTADAAGVVRAGVSEREFFRDGEYRSKILARRSEDDPWHRIDVGEAANEDMDLAFDGQDPNILYARVQPEHQKPAIVKIAIDSETILGVLASGNGLSLITHHGVLAGYVTADGPVYLDPAWEMEATRIGQLLKAPKPVLVDHSDDGKRITALVTQPGQPSQLWMLDRGPTPATLSPLLTDYDQIPADQIATPHWTSFAARDGLNIPVLVTLPNGSHGPIPFVVLPHGGPTAHDSSDFDWLVQFLVSRGYGVLQPQFRGSTGLGLDFQEKGYKQWGLAMQDDITDATRWAINQNLADPDKICIVGMSFGGYAALEGAVKEPHLYACAAAFAPVTDLRGFIADAQKYRYADTITPTIGDDGDALNAVSPARHADQIAIPVLLMHGRKDYTVPVEQTEKMERALKDAGKAETTLYLPDANHYLERPADRLALLNALEAFLAKSL